MKTKNRTKQIKKRKQQTNQAPLLRSSQINRSNMDPIRQTASKSKQEASFSASTIPDAPNFNEIQRKMRPVFYSQKKPNLHTGQL